LNATQVAQAQSKKTQLLVNFTGLLDTNMRSSKQPIRLKNAADVKLGAQLTRMGLWKIQ
jgi:hypothetical protein